MIYIVGSSLEELISFLIIVWICYVFNGICEMDIAICLINDSLVPLQMSDIVACLYMLCCNRICETDIIVLQLNWIVGYSVILTNMLCFINVYGNWSLFIKMNNWFFWDYLSMLCSNRICETDIVVYSLRWFIGSSMIVLKYIRWIL